VIAVRTKAGEVWDVAAFDTLAVRTASGAVASFQVADIAEVIIDAVGGQLSLLDGSSEGAEMRALQLVDGETGVPVKILFPLQLARHVGEKMAEAKIVVARTMPR
jgi:hypothetical protein